MFLIFKNFYSKVLSVITDNNLLYSTKYTQKIKITVSNEELKN
jgi:hypothetical protein